MHGSRQDREVSLPSTAVQRADDELTAKKAMRVELCSFPSLYDQGRSVTNVRTKFIPVV